MNRQQTPSRIQFRVTSLDPWKTAVLLSIKRQIDGGGSDGGEDVDLT